MSRMLKQRIRISLILILSMIAGLPLGALSLTGCTAKADGNLPDPEDSLLEVYSSFHAMYDFTKTIGGDKIKLTNLVSPGTEPHDWEPTPRDMANLEKADLLIYNGMGMESFMDKIKQAINNPQIVFVEASEGIPTPEDSNSQEQGHEEGHVHGSDPHVWLNPMYAKKQMENIKNALSAKDSANRAYYESNYEKASRQIDALDEAYREAVSGFSDRNIVVAHEAYGYLCDAYQLHQEPIEGIMADSEPSPARMAEIIHFINENDVKVIFYEELQSPKIAEVLAKETGAITAVLDPFEGATGTDDYFSVMYRNLEALRSALQ